LVEVSIRPTKNGADLADLSIWQYENCSPKQRISTLFVLVPFEMYAALDGVGDKDRLDRKGSLTSAITGFYEDR
jgi:hypothetical protein